MGKWKDAALNMRSLEKKYEAGKVTELRSVHKSLVCRILPQLYRFVPEAEKLFAPYLGAFIDELCAPDRENDREKGMGKHYYCACDSFGTPLKSSAGYYRNGIARLAPSARTLMEEDYTMAVTFCRAGFIPQGLLCFARALHMAEDMSCLPHASRMTYYSPKKRIHRAYEGLAKVMYPDFVPERTLDEADFHLFDDRRSFGKAFNAIVRAIPQEIPLLLTDPEYAITHRLYEAEKTVASMLLRFCEDISAKKPYPMYIEDGMKFRVMHDLPPLAAKVTPKGIIFTANGKRCGLNLGFGRRAVLFKAAHRSGGRFTFAPVSENTGKAVCPLTNRLIAFDPANRSLMLAPEK